MCTFLAASLAGVSSLLAMDLSASAERSLFIICSHNGVRGNRLLTHIHIHTCTHTWHCICSVHSVIYDRLQVALLASLASAAVLCSFRSFLSHGCNFAWVLWELILQHYSMLPVCCCVSVWGTWIKVLATNVLWTYGAVIWGSGRGQACTFGHRVVLYTSLDDRNINVNAICMYDNGMANMAALLAL